MRIMFDGRGELESSGVGEDGGRGGRRAAGGGGCRGDSGTIPFSFDQQRSARVGVRWPTIVGRNEGLPGSIGAIRVSRGNGWHHDLLVVDGRTTGLWGDVGKGTGLERSRLGRRWALSRRVRPGSIFVDAPGWAFPAWTDVRCGREQLIGRLYNTKGCNHWPEL
jgi:hypothetical protein